MMRHRARPRLAQSSWFSFTYRATHPLVRRMDEARWRLRFPSRTALVTRAIEEFLERNGIPSSTPPLTR